ncbi:TonB-dependent receptor [Granulicella aggregans]|uniref:TonB-dependent receptor n=1 Tax=Granulicella aggregans TaxID=474949 RepID=UPI0021DF74FB|nr:carboxypeptidase-like regulatory domain-containing protein [Granulicella aggregans]
MSISLSLLRKAIFAASLLSAAVIAAPLASAQQNNAVSGGLAGLITDSTGAAVPNAKITIVGPQGTTNLVSDAKGAYEARGLTPGLYTVTVKAAGFSTFISKDNEVSIDHTANLSASLSVGDAGVTVEVEGGATAIDVENSSVNTQLSDTFISDLPLPRNVSGAFYAAPGVVSGGGTGTANPSIGGSSGLENNYSADGVTITDQAYGGLGVYTPQYGSLGTGINQLFVKEVDIKTAAFEPKYGLGDGGIVEIVTKSGSNRYHGSLEGYLSPGWGYANRKQLYQYNYVVTTPSQTLSTPQYEGGATFGGYILRDKLFFFGAFDPTLNQTIGLANPAGALYSQGQRAFSTTSLSWSGKLTYTPFGSTVVELSSYGDPSRRNVAPESFSGTNFNIVSDSYNYGTRNSIARVNSVLYKGLTGFAAYAYSTEHFTDSPLADTYSISDRTSQPYTPYGFGTYYKTKDANYTLTGEMQATGNFFGKHTAMVGYYYNHVDFANSTLRTGASFAIPGTNAAGDSITSLYSNVPAAAVGKLTNATFYLEPVLEADGATPYAAGTSGCAYCGHYKGNDVYLQQIRGTYNGSTVSALSRYKSAYGNEVYSPNKYVTVNAGLRWEQQTYGGSLVTYNWRDNWSPRVGMTIDPFGTRKNAVKFAYSRYQNPLPLDAAVRQLGNEQDDTTFYFAPVTDASGNAVVDATGAVTPNTSTVLNGTAKSSNAGNFGAPNFGSSTGEGIIPGTKMEFADEYMLSVEHELKPGMIVKARYIDRQFARIVEDIGSTSPEGAYVDANYAGGIANPTASTDLFVNEKEVTYTPAQYTAANGGRTPGQATAANYVAPVAGCTVSNDTSVAYGSFFTHFDGTPYNGACITNASTNGASLGADGIPDGFANPRRHYQGLELEFDKAFSHHWQAMVNYRYAKLWGNYEGFYRNDNGQSDPGISSLFDFTQGALGLLGDQFKRGYLNEDRRSVANALVTYTLGKDTPYLSKLSGVTVGTWIHALSGTPLSAYESHPVYLNPGEVPVGGRGTLGTTPVNFYDDASISDSFNFLEKYTVKMGFDGFNIFNSQPIITKNQNLDTAPGVINADYGKPASFVTAFHARFNVVLSF